MRLNTDVLNAIDAPDVTLSVKTKERIKKTISRYAKPQGFCDALRWICFRVVNAFLSIFGCSDWQRTKRAAINEQLNANSVVFNDPKFSALSDQDKRKIRVLVHTFSDQIIVLMLNQLLRMQDAKNAEDIRKNEKKLESEASALGSKLENQLKALG